MKRKSKIIAIFLAAVFSMAAVLCSCGDAKAKNGEDAEKNTAGSETKAAALDNLPERNFGGYGFRLFLPEGRGKSIYVEEDTGEIVDDAVYRRNAIIEERFDIKISPVYYDNDWSTRMEGSKSILAGDDAFDLMWFHGRIAFEYANDGYVVDWLKDMPYVELSQPWWNQDVIEECSFFGQLRYVSGDIGYGELASTLCIYFNKNLFQALNIEYPYGDVVAGTWTLDKLISISRAGAADLNGDGTISPDADRYGFDMGNIYLYPTAILYCGGDKVIKKGPGDEPILSVYNEQTIDIYEKLWGMLKTRDGTAAVRGSSTWGNPGGIDIFNAGRALFGAGGIGHIIAYRTMEEEIGILPAPKYEESNPKYCSLVEAHGGLYTVPTTAGDLERTSIIAEALCAEGSRSIIPVYYEKALKTKYSRDEESAEMLDYVKNSAVYDYGYLNYTLSGALGVPADQFQENGDPNFTSLYEQNVAKVQSGIDKLIAER